MKTLNLRDDKEKTRRRKKRWHKCIAKISFIGFFRTALLTLLIAATLFGTDRKCHLKSGEFLSSVTSINLTISNCDVVTKTSESSSSGHSIQYSAQWFGTEYVSVQNIGVATLLGSSLQIFYCPCRLTVRKANTNFIFQI